MGFKWVSSNLSHIPNNAVLGGRDADGSPIYVGRSFHAGDWLPAKLIPRKSYAAVSFNGEEISVSNIQYLVEPKLKWVPSSNGVVPYGAVASGTTSRGETLYVGRGHHVGSLTVGKVHPSHGCLYLPFGNKEICVHNYEVLVED